MKIEQQVCTLEQAKRLKELGLKNPCDELFWSNVMTYVENEGEPTTTEALYLNTHNQGEFDYYRVYSAKPVNNEEEDETYGWYSAFTVAELGVMLPRIVVMNQRAYELKQWSNRDSKSEYVRHLDGYLLCYENEHAQISRFPELKAYSTEAEARAAMLIHLLENNLIKVEEVNQRLQQ